MSSEKRSAAGKPNVFMICPMDEISTIVTVTFLSFSVKPAYEFQKYVLSVMVYYLPSFIVIKIAIKPIL